MPLFPIKHTFRDLKKRKEANQFASPTKGEIRRGVVPSTTKRSTNWAAKQGWG